MATEDIFKQLSIPSPCSAQWKSMTGGNFVRSCDECGKQVYNLSATTPNELTSLVVEKGGNFCARVAVDRNGQYITSKSKLPPETARRPVRFHLRSLMLAIAGAAGAFSVLRHLPWSLGSESNEVAGKVMCIDPPSSTPPTAPTQNIPLFETHE